VYHLGLFLFYSFSFVILAAYIFPYSHF